MGKMDPGKRRDPACRNKSGILFACHLVHNFDFSFEHPPFLFLFFYYKETEEEGQYMSCIFGIKMQKGLDIF